MTGIQTLQEDETRHTAWRLQQELYRIERALADVRTTKFFKGWSPIEEANTSKPTLMIKSKDQTYTVDSGASSEFCLLAGKKTHTTDQTSLVDPYREWHSPFHKRGEGLRPGYRHLPASEVGGRFALGIMNEGILTVGHLSEIRHRQKARTHSRAVLTIPFLSSRSLSRRLLHLPGTTPRGKTLSQMKMWRKPCESSWKRHFQQKKKPGETSWRKQDVFRM